MTIRSENDDQRTNEEIIATIEDELNQMVKDVIITRECMPVRTLAEVLFTALRKRGLI